MHHRNTWRAARSAFCAAWLGCAAAGFADEIEEPKSVAEELIEILHAAGTIDEAQSRALRERARAEEAQRIQTAVDAAVAGATAAVDEAVADAALAAVSAPPASQSATVSAQAAAAEPAPEDWSFKWSNGFKLERNDGAFSLKFGGRVQSDWAQIDLNEPLENAIGGEGHGTEFRRARLSFEGDLYERLIFKAEYDFANTGDGTVDAKDIYLGLTQLGPLGTVKVGHFKEPFSLEEQTSAKYITFMERSLANAFSPARNTGFMASNAVLDERLLWQVGTFMDANDSGFSFDDDGNWNASARLVGVPHYADEGARVVHLGVGYSHQFRGGSDFMLRYRQRPESHLAPNLADTGAMIPTNSVNLVNPELAVVWGPASFQAEYMRAFADGDDGTDDSTYWGSYAQLSYFLTGEHRTYELGEGAFGRIKPNANFNPAQGDWGAFEVAARFSYLDLNDELIRGGRLWDITGGINWYLFPNARILLNYVHSVLENRLIAPDPDDLDGNADLVQARFELDF